ncbi:MAG: ABC transporter permease [Candidatus Dormibacteria bacterium]
MSLRRSGAIALRVIQQLLRDRRSLALLFGVPLLLIGLLAWLLREPAANLRLGIVNQDMGWTAAAPGGPVFVVAGNEVDALVSSSALPVTVTDLDQQDADTRLSDGSIDAYLLLPQNLSRDLLAGNPVSLELHLEGTDPSASGRASALVAQITRAVPAAAGALVHPTPAQGPAVNVNTLLMHGSSSLGSLDFIAPALMGTFAFTLVFVLTAVSFLRERQQGTLERLMASPLTRGEIVVGYMSGFGLFGILQAVEIVLFTLLVLRVYDAGSVLLVLAFQVLLTLAAVNLGITLSAFARSEFQAVQFIPLVIVPQVILSGVIFPFAQMPAPLQDVGRALPLTYANWGLRDVMLRGRGLDSPALLADLGVLAAFLLVVLALGGLTLRRRLD